MVPITEPLAMPAVLFPVAEARNYCAPIRILLRLTELNSRIKASSLQCPSNSTGLHFARLEPDFFPSYERSGAVVARFRNEVQDRWRKKASLPGCRHISRRSDYSQLHRDQ